MKQQEQAEGINLYSAVGSGLIMVCSFWLCGLLGVWLCGLPLGLGILGWATLGYSEND